MKFTRMIVPALVLGAALTTPAHAVPIVFDLSGTVAQHGGYNYGTAPGSYESWDDWESPGKTWSAQFVVETDLFGPLQTYSDERARNASFVGPPGAITPSLTVDGAALELAQFNTTSNRLSAWDSNGFITTPGPSWVIVPDQWMVRYDSREVTPQGTTSTLAFMMGFTEWIDATNMTGGTSMLDIEDVTSPLSFGSLLIPSNPLWFQDVELWLDDYDCDQTCRHTRAEWWTFTVTSVTRTVGSTQVPEPGTLALLLAGMGGALVMRRRRLI